MDDKDPRLERKVETLRLMYRNRGTNDLTEDELRHLVQLMDQRTAIWSGVIGILLVAGVLVLLVLRFA